VSVALRPRTAGEVLDDAWRLALADFPALFALAGAGLAPLFAALLGLLAFPSPDGRLWQLLAAAGVAALVPWSGVGSGACQEWLRRRAVGEQPTLGTCWKSALGLWWQHAVARVVVLSGVLLGLGCLIMPGLTLWAGGATVHAALASGRGRSSAGLSEMGREARFDAVKAGAVVLSRLPLLALTVINLHLLLGAALWALNNLVGVDVALLAFQFSLFGPFNPAYALALTLTAWLLLAPYAEASNFLLHLDTRTRQEGLDLLFRVQRLFPGAARASAVLLLALLPATATAAPTADDVKAARAEVRAVTDEVRAAEPYPGGGRWAVRLNRVARRLERAGGEAAFAWLRRDLENFADRGRDGALQVLSAIDARLALLEDTLAPPARPPRDPADVKRLLRPPPDDDEGAEPKVEKKERTKRVREERREDEVKRDEPGPRGRDGGGPAAPGGGSAGLGSTAWLFVGGVLLALLVLLLVLRRREQAKPPPPKTTTGPSATPPDELPPPTEAPPDALFAKADALAQAGRHLEALRALHRAVLSLLHRDGHIRWEPTRTNGEYVGQVRRSSAAPAAAAAFERLTDLFERLWYGERGCDAAGYADGRRLADEVRTTLAR
jgi:hypothetical protein